MSERSSASRTETAELLMWGFSLIGAMGFNGSLAVAMSSWDAWEVLEEVRSDWIHSMFWSWMILLPLPLVALEEQCIFWELVSSIKELRKNILNTRKLTSVETGLHFPLFFASIGTHHKGQIFRLESWTLLWIICSHLHGGRGLQFKNSAQPTLIICTTCWSCMFWLSIADQSIHVTCSAECEDVHQEIDESLLKLYITLPLFPCVSTCIILIHT